MNKRTLYFECYSGISGDMTVASLLDLGANEKILMEALESLNVPGFQAKASRTKKCGIDACDFDVVLEDVKDEHDHSHEHQREHCHENNEHGHEHCHEGDEHNHDHIHEHKHGHIHEYDRESKDGHTHHHEHRNIKDIYDIINNSGITDKAKDISKEIFHIVAKAEAKAHGVNIDEVHFHEVGAIDSIVDIVATAVCIDNLNIDDIVVSELYEGSGHVRCQHGIIPVPVPAVVNIVSDNLLQLRITDNRGEMITPTGAAIVAALKTKDKLPDSYKINKIGIGAGKKDFEKANVLRTYLIEESIKNTEDEVWVLETNIDDSTGENLAFTMEKLFENGARDVFFTPIYMKKNRPAQMLTVICKEDIIKKMEAIIFRNTTTIGIRKHKAERTILKREIVEVDTKFGLAKVKVCKYEDEKYYYPEYEDIKDICNKTGKSYKEVLDEMKISFSKI